MSAKADQSGASLFCPRQPPDGATLKNNSEKLRLANHLST